MTITPPPTLKSSGEHMQVERSHLLPPTITVQYYVGRQGLCHGTFIPLGIPGGAASLIGLSASDNLLSISATTTLKPLFPSTKNGQINIIMSFGFSVGDFIAVIELAIRIRKEFVDAPGQFKAISDECVTSQQ